MGISKIELNAIYLYIKRIGDFYKSINRLLSEASYIDLRYGYIVSGLDGLISIAGWNSTFTETEMATISGNVIGVGSYAYTISGWNHQYNPSEA